MTSMEVSEFEALRQHLMSVAYRLTGTVADAEDIVQEAWLRWDSQDTVIADPRAWLTTVVSRLGLDKLRSAAHRRETYTGTWLPEPVVTGLDATDPLAAVVAAEDARFAAMVVLERLRPDPVAARRWDIEPDLTNAVAFLSAAVVSGGTVRITGWPRVSVQPADHILAILRQLNAVVIHADSSLEVRGPTGYDGFDVDLRAVGELTPSVAALAALASPGSVSRLSGIAHLRGHETDRLAALSTEINRLGGTCRETPDGLVITATPLRPGIWRAYADHRMAMAGAIIGLRVAGVEVDDIAATTKTLPEFPRLWAEMVGPGQGWGYPQPRSGQRARRATGQGSGG